MKIIEDNADKQVIFHAKNSNTKMEYDKLEVELGEVKNDNNGINDGKNTKEAKELIDSKMKRYKSLSDPKNFECN